jgi:hypothetical protein
LNLRKTGIKKIIIFLFSAVILFTRLSSVIIAQELVSADKSYNERIFTLRVKQLNEFINRFNYEKDFRDNKIDYNFTSKISRSEYVRLLFNKEDSRLSDTSMNHYRNLVEEFILEIVDSSYLINKYSEKIFAELSCVVSFNNKKSLIRMILNQEVDTGLKWTICGINKSFIDELNENYDLTDSIIISQEINDSVNYIPPYSNETNFISLKKLLTKTNKNVFSLNSNFMNRERNYLFYYLVYKGIIKFHHVNKITYYIFDIPYWDLTLDNFIRNTDNSGWLISNLERTDSDIHFYFKNIYNIDITD